jgi:hypothetical protein
MRHRSFVLVAALVLSGGALSAHHSVTAIYDVDRLVTLVGVITRVSVANPHLTVDLKDARPNGAETTWTIEMAPPNALKRRGFDPQTLKPGQQIVIESWLQKDGRNEATGRTLLMSDGRRIDVGDSLNWSGGRAVK